MERFAQAELAKICASWTLPEWEELDWSRIKELSIRDTMGLREQQLVKIENANCVECPTFVKHVGIIPS
jgi:antiviral helicase SKI2